MSRLVETRSIGILQGGQDISVQGADRAASHRVGNRNPDLHGDPLPQASYGHNPKRSIDNDLLSLNQQPWPIQNT
jgi:hypothetical protein